LHFTILRIEVTRASRGFSAIAELLVFNTVNLFKAVGTPDCLCHSENAWYVLGPYSLFENSSLRPYCVRFWAYQLCYTLQDMES